MNKEVFEKIMFDRADSVYNKHKMELLNLVDRFFESHPNLNDHSSGHSMKHMVNDMVNSALEKRRAQIVDKYKTEQINELMTKLDSVRFLFENLGGS